jgi:hypothetical protein
MSYEKAPLVNRMARQLGIVAKHLSRAAGASRGVIETATQISPELGADARVFLCDELGLCRNVQAIGNYVGELMWDQYDQEKKEAEDHGYSEAVQLVALGVDHPYFMHAAPQRHRPR